MEDYICHFGRKGMKWHQHIFGNHKGVNKSNITEKTYDASIYQMNISDN